MPAYDVTAPDGRTFEVNAPEGATQDEVLAYAKRMYSSMPAPESKTGIGPAFESGVESYVSPVQTGIESITGSPEEAAKRGLERQQKSSQKYQGTSLDDISKIYQEQGFLPAAKKTIGAIPEAIASQVPQIGAMGIGATLGGIAGGILGTPADIVTGPGGTIVGAAAGAKFGQMVGQALSEFPQFFGSDIERQAQEQIKAGQPVDINRLKAAGAASLQTASDIFETQMLFGSSKIGQLLGFKPAQLAEKSAAQVEKMAQEKLLTTLAKGTAKGAAAEIPNEIFQQMLERAQAGLSVTDPAALKEYGDTAFQVGLLSPLGIVGSLGERGAARREVAARGLTPSGEPVPESAPIIAPTTDTAQPVTQAGVAPTAAPPIPVIPKIVPTPTGGFAPEAPQVTSPAAPTGNVANLPPAAPVTPPVTPAAPVGVKPPEQNRDRSTPASVAQMQSIAAKPMYEFLGSSNSIGHGSPIVTGPVKIPKDQLGKEQDAVAYDGTRIPTRYGVVEAKDLLPSHNADGSVNKEYGLSHDGLRVVDGNGRTAGLQAAYGKNTTADYVNKLRNDESHGISKEVIDKMQNPVLVRYASPDSVPANIGDLSNVAQTMNLSTLDQAKNDANRIDLNGLQFDDNGNITHNTLNQFISAMPVSERSALTDENGQPTRQARDRLNAAIFHNVYQNDDLTNLAHQADDEEATNIIKALSEAAPQMNQLADTGEYDIRPAVAQAAQLAVNARRNGQKLSDVVKQTDITALPHSNAIMQLFADNPRSSKKIAEGLKKVATEIKNEVDKPAEGLFGAEPKRSVEDILKDSLTKVPENDLFGEVPEKDKPNAGPKTGITVQLVGKAYDIPNKTKEQIHAELKNIKSVPELASWAVKNAPNPVAKNIAEKVLERVKDFEKRKIPMPVRVLDGSKRARRKWSGLTTYNPNRGGSISIDFRGLDSNGRSDYYTGTDYSTALHELVHSATITQLGLLQRRTKLRGGVEDQAIKDLKSLLTKVRKQVKIDLEKDSHDPLENHVLTQRDQMTQDIDELMAWGLTDEKFQHYLSRIQVGKKSALNTLIEAVRKLLGINPEYQSALDQLMTLTEKVFEDKNVGARMSNIGVPFGEKASMRYAERTPTSDRITKTAGVKTAGQRIRETVDGVVKNVQDNNFWTGQRVAWVDKNSGLAQDLASQPVFDMKGQLRADMLARTQDQILNYVHSGLQTGLPTINSDGTLGIDASENNLARSQILADELDKKGIVDIDGKKMSGRDAVAEIARILRGKDVIAEDQARNAKGRLQLAQAKALTQELKRLQRETEGKVPVKTMREYLNAIKYLRKEGYLNKNLNRELQVKDRHIQWASNTLAKTPEIKEILNIWKAVNDSLVTLWEESGLFTKDQADEYRGRDNYVPLFKAKEDLENGVNNPYGGAGSKSVKAVKKLQGSEAIRNIWENMNRHYASMVTAAYQNQTRKVATEQLKALGAAEIVDSSNPEVNLRYRDPTSDFADDKGIVSAIVHNPNTLAAFQMLHYELSPLMKHMAAATRVLRVGALINPMYWAKQLIRDPIHATLVGNSGIVTPLHAIRDYVEVLRNSSPEAKVLSSRGVIGQIDPTTDIYDFIKKAGEERKDPNAVQKALHQIQRMHELSDAATRVSVYKKAFADAKSRGMDNDQATNFAVHKARESINFAVRGNSKTLNAIRHMIPFVSAQITSLDSVYRAAFGKHLSPVERAEAQRAFRNAAMTMTMLSLAYAMMYSGDDDYDNVPDVVKDNNWLIPNPLDKGSFIKIPIPFEVGFLFKTVPEAGVRFMRGDSTGKEVIASYKNGLLNNLPGGGLSPWHFIPQAFRPILEIQSNYSNFTGRPIEGMSDQGKPVAFRGERASEMAKFLSKLGLDKLTLSPAKIDYLVQAYTAELGTFTNSMASSALETAEGKTAPAKNIEEYPGLRAFMTNPNSSKAVADFYDLDHKASELYSQFNTLKKTGQGEQAKEMLSDEQQKKLIQAAPTLRRIQTQMTKLHAQINLIQNDQRKSPEERRVEINRLEDQLDRVAKQGYKVAKSAGIER